MFNYNARKSLALKCIRSISEINECNGNICASCIVSYHLTVEITCAIKRILNDFLGNT